MQNDLTYHAECYSDAGRSSSGSRNEKICQFSQARRKSGRAKQNELTATMAHLSPLPLKAFKGPLASFSGVALFEPKLAEIRPSQRI